ncbi:MAG: TetR/AcrR family transcriptional regulator [Actinomycetota bacterium]|nr:TetR/AcrR family transcriptional regulator [Actinomycetota bacterium]
MNAPNDTASPPAGATRRKRAAHLGPERRRPLVLDAAYELFIENGFEGTSMDSIAAAAGVSKPVVYDCFASKDELFTAMLDREEERILVETSEALATTGTPDDPEATLIRGFQVFLEAAQKSPDIYRVVFLGEGGGNEAVAGRIARGIELQARTASGIAAHWVERYSDLEGDEARAAAELLGQTIVGLAQVGARTLLSGSGDWTPRTLGEKLGRMAWAARAAI